MMYVGGEKRVRRDRNLVKNIHRNNDDNIRKDQVTTLLISGHSNKGPGEEKGPSQDGPPMVSVWNKWVSWLLSTRLRVVSVNIICVQDLRRFRYF